jgi:hypothetical protein
MKKTLSTHEIAEALFSDENANWSRAGSLALSEWLEEVGDDTGEETDLDLVAIRGEFSEFTSLQDWIAEYYGAPLHTLHPLHGEDEDETDELIRDHIAENGHLIEFASGVIVSSF